MGILLYELLTGRVPRGSFPRASSLAAVPTAVDEVIHKALQVEPDKRFGSVLEMNEALLRAAAGVVSLDAMHQGTFTRVLNFGGLLKRVIPSHQNPLSQTAPRFANARPPRLPSVCLLAAPLCCCPSCPGAG